MTLSEFFAAHPKAALGFSGGVDSAYLLYAGLAAGADLRPYYIQTAFQPAFERADAERLATQLGVALTVIELPILENVEVATNDPRRCYHCKRALFGALRQRAHDDGYPLLLDGSNASDDAADRPGMAALTELSVRSPLRECGLTKAEIRRLSKEAGLFTWDKPAYACLATRIPTGTPLTAEALRKVERGEETLHRLGFSDFRLRMAGLDARIELPPSQMALAIERRQALLDTLSPDFAHVTLDIKGR